MVEIKTDIENKESKSNVKIYNIDGNTVIVRRKFDNGGSSLVEQVVTYLLDLMDKSSKRKNENDVL